VELGLVDIQEQELARVIGKQLIAYFIAIEPPAPVTRTFFQGPSPRLGRGRSK